MWRFSHDWGSIPPLKARYLAARLAPEAADIDALADTLAARPGRAMRADLFVWTATYALCNE